MTSTHVTSFIIHSNLGFFKKPDTTDTYLTYQFPPRSAILGILGAIYGFEGYNADSTVPDFYKKLDPLKMGIQPLELKGDFKPPLSIKDFQPLKTPLQKTFLTYNNYHGYGSYESGGNLVKKEQILINPSYRIYMHSGEIEEKIYDELIANLEKNRSYFTPYMGKNEFPIDIIFEENEDYKNVNHSATKIDTIYFDEIIRGVDVSLTSGGVRFYNIMENYPYKLKNSQYMYKKATYSNKKIKINDEKIDDRNYLLLTNNESTVFLF